MFDDNTSFFEKFFLDIFDVFVVDGERGIAIFVNWLAGLPT